MTRFVIPVSCSGEDYGKGERAQKDEIAKSGFAELIFSAIVHASVCISEFGFRRGVRANRFPILRKLNRRKPLTPHSYILL